MVQVAVDGRAIATRGTTGQVAGSHEVGELGRRDVAWLGHISRRNQWLQPGGLGQFGNHLRRDQAFCASTTPVRSRCRRRWLDRQPRGSPRCVCITRAAATQSAEPQPHTSRSAPAANAPSASARRCSRVRGSASHTVVRQLIQATVESATGGGQHAPGHIRHARFRGVDVDEAIPDRLPSPAAPRPDRLGPPLGRPRRPVDRVSTTDTAKAAPPEAHPLAPAHRRR